MAKKIEGSKKGYSFGDLQDLVENISKKTSISVERDRNDETFISTGVHVMDALLAKSILKGGISRNRITIFAGDPGTGKSYLCYNIARNAQKDGYSVIYIDTEYSATNSTFESFGIDISEDKFMLISSNNVEGIKVALTQIIGELKNQKQAGYDIPKTIIFLDSIGNLASTKEITDAMEGNNKQDMSRAKALKSLFRIISSDLGFLEIPLVMTNHIYMTMDLFPQAVMNGGKGAEYAASSIVYLTTAKLKTGQEDDMDLGSSGVVVTAKARKNRLAKPKKIKFNIDHSEGTNPYSGLDFWCTPENFEKVGIARGKMVKNKDGNEVFEAGAQKSKWYVRHLDKTLYDKQLYNGTVFNEQVLAALDPIIVDYFKYSSWEEIQRTQQELDGKYSEYESDDEVGGTFDIDNDRLFD